MAAVREARREPPWAHTIARMSTWARSSDWIALAGVLVEERAQILGADRRIVVFHGDINATSHGGDRDQDRRRSANGMHAAQAAGSVALERRHAIGDAWFTLRS